MNVIFKLILTLVLMLILVTQQAFAADSFFKINAVYPLVNTTIQSNGDITLPTDSQYSLSPVKKDAATKREVITLQDNTDPRARLVIERTSDKKVLSIVKYDGHSEITFTFFDPQTLNVGLTENINNGPFTALCRSVETNNSRCVIANQATCQNFYDHLKIYNNPEAAASVIGYCENVMTSYFANVNHGQNLYSVFPTGLYNSQKQHFTELLNSQSKILNYPPEIKLTSATTTYAQGQSVVYDVPKFISACDYFGPFKPVHPSELPLPKLPQDPEQKP